MPTITFWKVGIVCKFTIYFLIVNFIIFALQFIDSNFFIKDHIINFSNIF